MKQDVLQPIDVLVCLKMSMPGSVSKSFKQLEEELCIHSATLHRATKRAQDAGLIKVDRSLNRTVFLNFLRHGIKYAFYVKRGGLTRGIPTAYATAPLDQHMTEAHEIPVWPDVEGYVRGFAVSPLHPNVPEAAKRDRALYELLALVDAIRIGNTREYKLAVEFLEKRLKPEAFNA